VRSERARWIVDESGEDVRLCEFEACDRLARFREGRGWERWCGSHWSRVRKARAGLRAYRPVASRIMVARVREVPE
jgi:hypothetical protein